MPKQVKEQKEKEEDIKESESGIKIESSELSEAIQKILNDAKSV